MLVDLPRSDRHLTATRNRRVSFGELAQDVNISSKTVHGVLTDILGMKREASRLVPKELNIVQKEHRKQVTENRTSIDSTPMKRIITDDKTWIYEYDIQTSQQFWEWCFKNRKINDYQVVAQSEFAYECEYSPKTFRFVDWQFVQN